MRPLTTRALLSLGLTLALALGWAPAIMAQATTGTLTGAAVDESGAALPGASVTATHEPTGTKYSAVTDADGHFTIVNVRVGGPYAVTVDMSGFKSQTAKDVTVQLGQARDLQFKLPLQSVTEEVTVTAEVSPINPSAGGPVQNVGVQAIQTLPTIARGLEDFARLSPYFNSAGGGDGTGASTLSVAGRNNRYNNVQIDGAVNNDVFGLADSGTPGGQTESQPISLDAIQEIQLLVAPYDVRQGGFTGGGLNAITRSGANTFGGTAYYFFRDESMVGDGPDKRPIATFNDKQYGASLGGPIQKDKIFFFANVDFTRKDTPVGFSASGSSGQDFNHEAEAERFRSILQSKYGYDPGGLDEFIRNTESNKFFGRLDFNLSDSHRLTLRHNYIDGANDIGFPSSRLYLFGDNYYHFKNKTNTSVLQLNSNFGSKVNELRVTYERIRDQRNGDTRFPLVLVDISGGAQLRAGRENFSTANELDQDVIELTDDLTFSKGAHLITVGTHNEFYKFRNLFIRDNFGNYRFSSLDNLEAGIAQSYDYSFSNTLDPQQPARFKVQQFGFYASDMWRAAKAFTVTFGVRVDLPHFPDKPTENPTAQQVYGFATNVAPSPTMFSPRASFNWDLGQGGGTKQQLRGGIGMFTGRTPYVWLSNQYGNTAIEFTRVSLSFNAANKVTFVPNPDAQPKSVGRASSNEVDFVDPDYKFPQVLRMSLGYDRELAWGIVGSVEGLYSKNLQDIDYRNLNLKQIGTRPDGRPLYARTVDPRFSDAILLTNTTEGSQWTLTAKLERPFRNGLFATLSWLYGESDSVNDGGSSQAASNWGNVYTSDSNNAGVGTSRFSPGHRITAAVSKDWQFASRFGVTTSLYYNGQSGRPYSFDYNSDWNGDNRFTNDLIYVPANANEVIVTGGTWDQLNAYIEADEGLKNNRGRIVPRNASRAPWTNQLDFRAAVGLNIQKKKVELTADVLNLLNLFSSTSGVINFATFNDLNPIKVSLDAASGKPIYDISTLTAATYRKFDRDDLRSRWQAQLGLRFRF